MSEHGDGAVNPGQAINDALSDEAKAAVDALPDDVFAGANGLAAAKTLAWAIRTCSQTRPQMWTILCDSKTSGRDFVCLNVAMNNMITWSGDALNVAVSLELEMSPELRGQLEQDQIDRSYKHYGLVASRVTPDFLTDGEHDELIEVLERTLRIVADQTWTRNQRANEHRDDWRAKLAILAGTPLAPPSYVRDHLAGLDMHTTGTVADRPQSVSSQPAPEGLSSIPMPPPPVDTSWLAEFFAAAGLTYTPEQIAAFYTALQTKGFVILSGISGTGKSKIAQHFARLLPGAHPEDDGEPRDSRDSDSTSVAIRVDAAMKNNEYFRLQKSVTRTFPFPDLGSGT